MVISNDPSYEELKEIFIRYFGTAYLGRDINKKFALISLICYVTHKIREKKPDITHLQVLNQINKKKSNSIPEYTLQGLAAMCEDFSYGCDEFPTFGIEDKKMPDKIKELLGEWLPF